MVSFKIQNEGGVPVNVVLCHDEEDGIVIHLFTKNLHREHLKNRIKLKAGEGVVIAEEEQTKKLSYIR